MLKNGAKLEQKTVEAALSKQGLKLGEMKKELRSRDVSAYRLKTKPLT